MGKGMKTTVLNVRFNNISQEQLIDEVFLNAEEKKKTNMVFVNTDVVIKAEKDSLLQRILDESEYVLADGMPLIWVARLFGTPLCEKISGSDFVPRLCQAAAERGKSIFFVGGGPQVAEKAAENLKARFPQIKIAGCYAPPFGFEKDQAEIEKTNKIIKNAAPDIVIICLGCPKQEKFMFENCGKYNVPVSVCAGATIDFLAGNVRRCPAWMSSHGLEWFYRFLQEPKRLFKRYFIDDVKILHLICKYRPGKK